MSNHAATFWKLRIRLLRNARTQLFGNSRVRLFTMIASSVVVWIAVYAAAHGGFQLLNTQNIPPGAIVDLIFNAMFFTLGTMLVFSTGLMLYASLFNGAETRFLLATPAREDHIFASKFQGASLFSSWAFLVLGVPVLLAYGIVFAAPWYFYPLLFVHLLGFVFIPGSVGAILCLILVNFFPHRRKQALIVLILGLAAALGYWGYKTVMAARVGANNREELQGLFDMFSITKGIASPSDWLSHGVLSAGRGNLRDSVQALAVVWSNGLALYLLATFLAKRMYRRGFNRMATGGDIRRTYGRSRLDTVMEWSVFYLKRETRILIVKDFRTFRREPAQIGQVVIFGGLVVLAALNMRGFFEAGIPEAYSHALSLLKISATGLLMCAFLGRFVYPLISLEGRKFWILGLLPLRREQILWGKFAYALTGSLLLAGSLGVISDLVMGLSPFVVGLHLLTILYLGLGLSGLSVGISACLPNFRETDPSKIVLGFGGTVNMLIGLGYLVIVIVTMCGPYHLSRATESLVGQQTTPWWLLAGGVFLATVACVLATWLPMRAGYRNFKQIEF
ncbi:putative ABC transporter permease subunit [Zavarzinella formosa]|uniref:putative ABC transporter permease subunit n=1 Tax=Zavarzinella formosa TaxID=360055 RepID=UPI0002FE573B|nr:hypothetical protein [Zavarzinella formosa]